MLCQQTDDPAVAQDWFETLVAGGIEGVVVKDASAPYPTAEGQRVWWKRKARTDLDMLAVGFTGTADAPTALVLAFPGQVDSEGNPVTAGATTVLNRTMQRTVAPLLQLTGATFSRTFAWGKAEASTVTVIDPFVVEVSADAAAEPGTLRHAARLMRTRPDLDPTDV